MQHQLHRVHDYTHFQAGADLHHPALLGSWYSAPWLYVFRFSPPPYQVVYVGVVAVSSRLCGRQAVDCSVVPAGACGCGHLRWCVGGCEGGVVTCALAVWSLSTWCYSLEPQNGNPGAAWVWSRPVTCALAVWAPSTWRHSLEPATGDSGGVWHTTLILWGGVGVESISMPELVCQPELLL
jgi:hypothetical protein